MDRSALKVGRFRIGDCVIDRSQRTVTNGTGRHRPRPKVFDVLLYLADNSERVVTKEELFGALWPGTSTTDDALVACVREIRHLLGDDSRHPQIVLTAPKKGYLLTAPPEPAAAAVPREIPAPDRPKTRVLHWIIASAALAVLAIGAALYIRPVRQALVGWWRFDEAGGRRVLDRSGCGNDGIIFNGLRREPSPHGSALVFDGKGYVNGMSPGNLFPSGDSAFTISAWLNCRRVPQSGASLLQFGTHGWDPPRANMLLRLAASGALAFGCGFGYQMITGTTRVDDGVWHHVAGVYAAGSTRRMELFADGEAEISGILPEPPHVGKGSVWTMGVYQGGGVPFEGMLADVRLYRRALTHPQLAALYRCGLPAADIPLPQDRHGYYLPLYRATISGPARPPDALSAPFVYDGFGRGGVEFAASNGTCTLPSLRGAALGDDLRIRADILLPAATEGGPFFRARRVAPGDPIEGGGNGGYWVRLHADGSVSVHSLNQPEQQPNPPFALAAPPPGFARGQFHTVEAEVRGHSLRVWLDHAPVRFPGGEMLSAPDNGHHDTAAGIGFFVEGEPVESIRTQDVEVRSLP